MAITYVIVIHKRLEPIPFGSIREPDGPSTKFSTQATGIIVKHFFGKNYETIVVIAVNFRWASYILFIGCQSNEDNQCTPRIQEICMIKKKLYKKP